MNILESMFITGDYIWPAIILVTSLVEGIYFIRLLLNLWHTDGEIPKVKFEFVLKYVVVIIAVLIMIFGVYTEPVQDSADDLVAYSSLEGGNL